MTVFLEGREPLRSEAAFDARIAELRGGIGLPAQEISRAVQAALERLARIQAALPKAPPPAAADIRAQLAWLVPAGFLLTTPWERLQEFPRYLQAHRAAAREAAAAIRGATRSSRPRSRRSRRATASGSRPSAACGRRATTSSAGCSRSSACRCSRSSSRRAMPVSARRLADAWAERERLPIS